MRTLTRLQLKYKVMRCLIESDLLTGENADDILELEIPDHFRFYWRLPTLHQDDLPGPKLPPSFDVSYTTNMRLCIMHYTGRKPNQGRPFIPDGSGGRIYLHDCNLAQQQYIAACFQFLRNKKIDLEIFNGLDDGGVGAAASEEDDEEEEAVGGAVPEGIAVALAADNYEPSEEEEEDDGIDWVLSGDDESGEEEVAVNEFEFEAESSSNEAEIEDQDNEIEMPPTVYVEDMFTDYVPNPDVQHEEV